MVSFSDAISFSFLFSLSLISFTSSLLHWFCEDALRERENKHVIHVQYTCNNVNIIHTIIHIYIYMYTQYSTVHVEYIMYMYMYVDYIMYMYVDQ